MRRVMPGNPTVNFRGERRRNATHASIATIFSDAPGQVPRFAPMDFPVCTAHIMPPLACVLEETPGGADSFGHPPGGMAKRIRQ